MLTFCTGLGEILRAVSCHSQSVHLLNSGLTQAVWRQNLSTSSETKENSKDGTVFVWVPRGQFLFGPLNEVKYLSGFWIGKDSITRGQFQRFLKETGYVLESLRFRGKEKKEMRRRDSDPHLDYSETMADYNDALAYAKWASASIPTEMMWEKAARGTDGRVYPWGDTPRSLDGPHHGDAPAPQWTASPYGCIGMAYGVLEWTSTGRMLQPTQGMAAYVDGLRQFQTVRGFAKCFERDEFDASTSRLIGFRLAKVADK